ncbi:MAG: AraC family transcriptional regulator [Acetatifactor sp.]|nr:AraC family transcriptional regulator [Acetatifactor sp.]
MINIIKCGHDSHHPKPCNIEHKHGVPNYLLLLIKKEAWITVDGCLQNVHPNSVICFPPNTYIHYGCDLAGYNDDWIHFTLSEDEKSFWEQLEIPLYTILSPHNFHKLSEYVKLLSDAFHNDSSHREQILDSFMHIFLYTLNEELYVPEGHKAPRKYYSVFASLRTGIYNDPSKPYTVPLLADEVGLSLSYFQHQYKEFFGCSCQQDIINARLKLAQYYLESSDMPIHGIADFCGYETEVHFMRQFKKFIGVTPSEYRSSFSSYSHIQ